MRPILELAHVVKTHEQEFIKKHQPLYHHGRVLRAITQCRTAALGGHVDRCDSCAHERISYNSCRNRHCPKCQGTNRERWIEAREQDLLNVNYFHVVFTIPQEFNVYCLKYPEELYDILFKSSKDTLFQFAQNPKHLGADIGFISVLHTWGQTLQLHPHVHMIVPGGGITKAGKWKTSKSDGDFLFPVNAMKVIYKNKFMAYFKKFLQSKQLAEDVATRRYLYKKEWVVYVKEPFNGPGQVIEYLGRYTHKIAISNHRLLDLKEGKLRFKYKDYRHGNVNKVMELDALEFIRRFCLHILPPGYVKMRHYGILSNRGKQRLKEQQVQQGIMPKQQAVRKSYKEISKERLNFDVEKCPCCKTGRMITIEQFAANAPPQINRYNDKKLLRNPHHN